MQTQHQYQVNFDKVFIGGLWAGHRYHHYLKFATFAEAKFFAGRDGLIIASLDCTSDYRQEDSTITKLE